MNEPLTIGRTKFDLNRRGINLPATRTVVKANETPAAKQYRLAVAIVREFAKEYPKEAREIIAELAMKAIDTP